MLTKRHYIFLFCEKNRMLNHKINITNKLLENMPDFKYLETALRD